MAPSTEKFIRTTTIRSRVYKGNQKKITSYVSFYHEGAQDPFLLKSPYSSIPSGLQDLENMFNLVI
jgi:hypothetical protein